jgi:uncharacterized protein YecE (DUF72 family)
MTNILVGTTSWTEKTLLDSKRFYPSNATTSAARLRYYATQFRIVEVDSSYYFRWQHVGSTVRCASGSARAGV